jgi:uncharacterized protein (DUF1810 family)
MPINNDTNIRKPNSINPDPDDPFSLSRFTTAQEGIYDSVLTELRSGLKRTHWMWFIFPQIDGLGHSFITKQYSIKSILEAEQYLKHPILGPRLIECSHTVLALKGRSISDIFGYPDDMKLKSSMTLFECVAGSPPVFAKILDKYFHGERDTKTLSLLGMAGRK